MPEKKPPRYPVDPVTHALNLPADVVHELFHLAQDNKEFQTLNSRLDQLEPVKTIVFGLVGLWLTGLGMALLYMVVRARPN